MRPRRCVSRLTVHPRVRGEQRGVQGKAARRGGSSPRARGTGGVREPADVRVRFIPACAGNSRSAVERAGRRAVHPRVRGEQANVTLTCVVVTGSSPRARGTVTDGDQLQPVLRFIPACAGNRSRSWPSAPSASVHPRVRGEQRVAATRPCSNTGSSPRARGTDLKGATRRSMGRFIPACAGNRIYPA